MTSCIASQAHLFACLEKLFNRTIQTHTHEALYTCENWQALLQPTFGTSAYLCKNLFLRDKKKHTLWLAIAKEDTPVDMNALGKAFKMGSGNLRFAPDDVMSQTLGVEKGSVTPLALFLSIPGQELNETTNKLVQEMGKLNVLVDKNLIDAPQDTMALFHPLINTQTSAISVAELLLFLGKCQVQSKQVVDFSTNTPVNQI